MIKFPPDKRGDGPPNLPPATVSIGRDGLTVRTRRRGYLVAFAIGLQRRPFTQFGNKIIWFRR